MMIAVVAILFVGAVFLAPPLAEVVLVGGYIAGVVRALLRWNSSKGWWVGGAACAGALIMHLSGWKFFGRPVTANLVRLKNPVAVFSLQPPAIARLADGQTFQIEGVWFPALVDLEGARQYTELEYGGSTYWGTNAAVARGMRVRRKLGMHSETGGPVAIEAPGLSGKAACLSRVGYFCGNTWSPYFFPRRLPKKEREDFGIALVEAGLALPTVEALRGDRRYAERLLQVSRYSFPELPHRDTNVTEVAKAIIELHPDFLEVGAHLIVSGADTNNFAWLASRVRGEIARSPQGNDSILHSLLAQTDYEYARESATNAIAAVKDRFALASTDPRQKVFEAASYLAGWNDLAGFDFLVEEFSRLPRGNAASDAVGQRLCIYFRFLENVTPGYGDRERLFLEWYREVRGRLRWVSVPGRDGFSVNATEPYDAEYFETMERFRARALNEKTASSF
jgi:hypothetical protein